jgi:hypothetical protein
LLRIIPLCGAPAEWPADESRASRGALEFSQQVQEHQHAQEGQLSGEELLQAEIASGLVTLQLLDASLYPASRDPFVVVAPYLFPWFR